MLKVLLAFASLIALAVCQTPFQGNKDWCVPAAASSGPSYPTLPVEFQTVVEANYRTPGNNFTAEFEEYYDFINDRGLLIKYSLLDEVRQYFLYDTDEMITTYSKVCTVEPISKAVIPFASPFQSDKLNGTSHIFSPINALNLEYTQTYMGEDTLRGISVKRWNSCAYIEQIKSTVRIYWSFSNNNTWNSTISIGGESLSVPVEMSVEGITDSGETFEQHYQYIKFRPYLVAEKSIFETPTGIFCPGRKATKPLPKIPPHFSFRIEATSTDLQLTVNKAEWYDDENKLVRLDHQTLLEDDLQAYGQVSLTEVHDFKRGIKFIIDRTSQKCLNYTVLDAQALDSDYAANSTNYVRLRTAIELFNFGKNASVNYQYHGTKKVRDVNCDVWIAERENWPPQPNVNRTSTWEWYFMTTGWTNINFGIEEFNIPMKLIVTNYNYLPDGDKYISTTLVYNYFDYNQEKPDIFTYDLQLCFEDVHFKHLMFKLGTPYTQITENRRDVKYAVLTALSKLGYLLPTRITSIEVEAHASETLVIFKLLDKLPIRGDVENPVTEISLKDAYSLIQKAVNSGEFSISLNGTTLQAKAKSLQEIDTKNDSTAVKGTTVYIIIGSGVGGIIIGVLVVLFVTLLMRKRNNNNEPVLRMSGLMNPNFNDTECKNKATEIENKPEL